MLIQSYYYYWSYYVFLSYLLNLFCLSLFICSFLYSFQVASRRVFQTAGLILIVCGIVGKFGAILTLIPEPIIGGTLTVVFGMVAAVGISTLRYIDMSSTRNLTILAISIIFGLMIPEWLNKHPTAINTGKEFETQIFIFSYIRIP